MIGNAKNCKAGKTSKERSVFVPESKSAYSSMDEYYEHLRADNIEEFSEERNDEFVYILNHAEKYPRIAVLLVKKDDLNI